MHDNQQRSVIATVNELIVVVTALPEMRQIGREQTIHRHSGLTDGWGLKMIKNCLIPGNSKNTIEEYVVCLTQ